MRARGAVTVGAAIAVAVGVGNEGWAQEAPAAEAPAPTRANILSTSSQQWEVFIDDQWTCSTPCSGPLFPHQYVVLHSQSRRPVIVEVGRLPPGDVVVSAKPLESGKYAGGVVATSLGGMAVAVGVTLLSVGLAKDRGGMTTAGIITGAAGLLTLPFGIYLMVDAVPSFRVDRAGAPGAVAAAGIVGTF